MAGLDPLKTAGAGIEEISPPAPSCASLLTAAISHQFVWLRQTGTGW